MPRLAPHDRSDTLRRNTDHILVSHAGNLPRPKYLDELIEGGVSLEASTGPEYRHRFTRAVKEIVDQQITLGVDIVNDGDYSKAGSYGGYLMDRVKGDAIEPVGESPDPARPAKRAGTSERDRREFPGFYDSGLWSAGPIRPGFATRQGFRSPNQRGTRVCTSAVTYTGGEAIQADIANLKAAIQGKDVDGYTAALGAPQFGGSRTQWTLRQRRRVHDGGGGSMP